ncbi:MAG TPA: FAD-linked oxidase C-terminal domain-containing protein [Steroidobacteraceae bacterium]|nr:FAD-linked oxidase C-terminal domain-containing protein [Steroidobacteraceae bacterium]
MDDPLTRAASPAGGTEPPPADVVEKLQRRLRRETRGEALFGKADRGRYATDASIYQIMPAGVFIPSDDADLGTALDIARDLSIPVVPRGGGTSQCGQTVGAGLVIDNSKHLRQVLDIDAANRIAVVEPGLVLDHLNARLAPHGLWFPVDVSTGAQATLGGMAGNNSCGSRSIAYGNMVHNVLGVGTWLADGTRADFGPLDTLTGRAAALASFVRELAARHRREIVERWPKVMRRVGGYNLDIFDNQSERPYGADGDVNLAHLLIGSEGSLAYTRTLTLKLAPRPPHRVLGVVNFPSFRASMESAQHLVKLAPSAVELVDRILIDLGLANPSYRPLLEAGLIGRPAAVLLVEFSGENLAGLESKLSALVSLMGDLGFPGSVVSLTDPAAQKGLWEVRKAGLNIMMSLKGDGKPVSFIEDCAVPLEHLAEYTDALTEIFARHGTHGTWYAHASVGTLHVRPILDMRRDGLEGGASRMRAIAEEAAALVTKFRGAYSGEHGDGICRGEWIRWQFGDSLNEAFRDIKRELDPRGLFNPGKIVDPPRMDDTALFRFAPPSARNPYRTIALEPVLDWSAWDVQNDALTEEITAPGSGGDATRGFAKAVEMCNNNGHCRQFDAGTMCPSYRVTRDERHLTRGRANTLRLALSGQLGPDALAGDALREAMELCVGCKGCKRECPTGVDIARMKIEFLAHYKARRGYSLRDRLIAKLPDYSAAASRFAWLSNLRETVPGARRLSERLLGFSAKRSLPRWRADTFWRDPGEEGWASREAVLEAGSSGKKAAVLFVDTFNGTFERENAVAAGRVLRAAGYLVHTLPRRGTDGAGHYCCGRTYLSVGMVDGARIKARRLVQALEEFARRGIAIVGLEPSCLLTLRDETLVMGLGESARLVASQAMLFEEFIAREIRAGRFSARFRRADRPVLVHGHCHQKAFAAVAPMLEVLALIPSCNARLIESSCCGMAGSFGYEAAHHEVSMQMAELTLLPAVRAAPDAIVVADGTSCRHQIAHGAQRVAVHAARLLDRLMD